MSSADIALAMNYVSREKTELEQLRTKLSGKKINSTYSVTRDSGGMDGEKYVEQHKTTKELFKQFVSKVKSEKSSALSALDTKINSLETKLSNLNSQYNAEVARERAAAEARKAQAKAEAEARKNKK